MSEPILPLPEDAPILDASDPNFKKQLDFALWSVGGSSDYRNDRERPYNGQSHTDQGERGKTEVRGLTMRDVKDCYVMGYLMATGRGHLVESGKWRYQMVYEPPDPGWEPDELAVAQNMLCCIEKMMGIFPNVPRLRPRGEAPHE